MCPICEVVILTVLSANIHINRVGPRCRLTSVGSGHNAFCVTCHITTYHHYTMYWRSRVKRGYDEVVVTYFARQSSETALLITQLVHHRRTNVFDKFALHDLGTVTHW